MSDLGFDMLVERCAAVHSKDELRRKLQKSAVSGKPLRVKLGMDPTAPDIHIGHSVVLGKMREFQDLGHVGVLVIGDFTARIGDPTGKSKTRPQLTPEEINKNAQTYLDQAGKVLDISPTKLEIRRNSEWLGKMDFADVIRLSAQMTVGQMLAREDFRNRFESQTPISLHELLYPLVQGWDSVNLHSDIELGGTDQTYNNLVGRDLQQNAGQEPQIVMIMPILRGLDGVKKMSKSLGNYIAVNDTPRDMYGKTMSIPDELLAEWFGLVTSVPPDEFKAAIAENPFKAKGLLARAIGRRFHSTEEMELASQWWHESFSAKKQVDAIDVSVPADDLVDGKLPAWKLYWIAHSREISKGDARRMVEGGAFEFAGAKVTDPNQLLALQPGVEFKAGRHRSGERTKQPLIARVVPEGW